MKTAIVRIFSDSADPNCADAGNGVIISPHHIMTAKHVVSKAGCAVELSGRSGRQDWQLSLAGSIGDVAVLEVDPSTPIDFASPLPNGLTICTARLSRETYEYGQSTVLSIPPGFDDASSVPISLNGSLGASVLARGYTPEASESGGAVVLGGYVIGTIEGFYNNNVAKVQPISRYWELVAEHGFETSQEHVCDIFAMMEKLFNTNVSFVGGTRTNANFLREYQESFRIDVIANADVASAYGLGSEAIDRLRTYVVQDTENVVAQSGLSASASKRSVLVGSNAWRDFRKIESIRRTLKGIGF